MAAIIPAQIADSALVKVGSEAVRRNILGDEVTGDRWQSETAPAPS
jgi:hypothetical protein